MLSWMDILQVWQSTANRLDTKESMILQNSNGRYQRPYSTNIICIGTVKCKDEFPNYTWEFISHSDVLFPWLLMKAWPHPHHTHASVLLKSALIFPIIYPITPNVITRSKYLKALLILSYTFSTFIKTANFILSFPSYSSSYDLIAMNGNPSFSLPSDFTYPSTFSCHINRFIIQWLNYVEVGINMN